MLAELCTDLRPLLARNVRDQTWTVSWPENDLQPHQLTSMGAGERSKDTTGDLFARADRQRYPAMSWQAHRRRSLRIDWSTPGSSTQPNQVWRHRPYRPSRDGRISPKKPGDRAGFTARLQNHARLPGQAGERTDGRTCSFNR
ncbi:hypothetical protein GCM10009855_36420 [Gordonia cholesterolivorans]|uniref:Uncharacterized protein n=1 Tax=Gordonia cholesterolivorans TaxID=559625 RepID=A0ABN3I3Q3_9ACTN